jgi:Mlc titration factor MtfA (ptsG expression regulator)
MTQALYAHMNNKKQKFLKNKNKIKLQGTHVTHTYLVDISQTQAVHLLNREAIHLFSSTS